MERIRKNKFCLLLMLLFIFTFSIVEASSASQDGRLMRVCASSTPFKSGAGGTGSLLMTCYFDEAIINTYASTPWCSAKGYKSSTGSVINGYVQSANIVVPSLTKARVALNVYSSASDSSYTGVDIPANAYVYAGDTAVKYTYSNMYFGGTDHYILNGRSYDLPGSTDYVHTNFRTSSPSNYYLRWDY